MTVQIGTIPIRDEDILNIMPEPGRPRDYAVRLRSGAVFMVYGCDLDADIQRLRLLPDYDVIKPRRAR